MYKKDPNQTSGNENYNVWVQKKKTLDEIKGKLEIIEGKIYELEGIAIETIKNETQRK